MTGVSALNELPLSEDLQISWLSRRADLVPLYPDWQALARSTAAEVYLHPVWFDVWWDHFGVGRRLVCLIAHRQGRLAGVLPFVLQTVWAGPIPLRVARLAGTDPNCIVFRLPVEPDVAPALMAAALHHLLTKAGCSAISLTPVSGRSDILTLARATCGGSNRLTLTDRPAGGHIVFDLADSFADFTARLSGKRRTEFRRSLRDLQAAYHREGRVSHPASSGFSDFIAFHTRQWQAVGKGGHFSDWPGSGDFYRALADRSAAQADGVPIVEFHIQEGSTGPLTTQFVLMSGPTAHWRLPARTLEPAAERMGVGKVGLLLMIEQLIKDGVRCIEGGRGEYGYKLQLGGEEVPVHRIIVSPASLSGRLGIRLLLGWSDMINFFYYRLWFLKVAPHLRRWFGVKPAPLSRLWIRTRL